MAKRKRGHGEGSVYFDRGLQKWSGAISRPDGKRKYFRSPVKADVLKAMDEYREKLRKGIAPDPNRELMVDYLERWLADVVKTSTKPATYLSYRSVIDIWVKPHIQNVPTTEFTPEMVANLLTAVRAKGAGSRTRENCFVHLRNAFNHLVTLERISRNPCKPNLKPPHRQAEMRPWTPEEAERFLEVNRGDWYFAAYYFTLITGLREGEVSALKVSDVNLERMDVSVKWSRSQISNKKAREEFGLAEMPLQPPKSGESGTVSFGKETVSVLRTWLATRMKMGFAGRAELFLTTDGKYIRPSYLYKVFQTACRRAGVPVIRFHDLRHTSATFAFLKGYNVVEVQKRLRHATPTMTLRYTHVLEARARTLGSDMERIGVGTGAGQ